MLSSRAAVSENKDNKIRSTILTLALDAINKIKIKQNKKTDISRILALALIENRIHTISDDEIIQNFELADTIIRIAGKFGPRNKSGSNFLKNTNQFLLDARKLTSKKPSYDKGDAKAGKHAEEIKKNLPTDSNLQALPRVLLNNTMEYSDTESVTALLRTNRFFKKSIQGLDNLWEGRVARDFLNYPRSPGKKIMFNLLNPSINLIDEKHTNLSWNDFYRLCIKDHSTKHAVEPVIKSFTQFPSTDDFKNYVQHPEIDLVLTEKKDILTLFYNWVNQHSRNSANSEIAWNLEQARVKDILFRVYKKNCPPGSTILDLYNIIHSARAEYRKSHISGDVVLLEIAAPTLFPPFMLIEIAIRFAPIAVVIRLIEKYKEQLSPAEFNELLDAAVRIGRLSICKLLVEYYQMGRPDMLNCWVTLSKRCRNLAVVNGHIDIANYFHETYKYLYKEDETRLTLDQVFPWGSVDLLKYVGGDKKRIFDSQTTHSFFKLTDSFFYRQIPLLYVMNFQENISDYAIQLAVRQNLTPVLEYFVSCRGASLDQLDENGNTLLTNYFREHGLCVKHRMAKYLIDAGVNVSHSSKSGETALILINNIIKARNAHEFYHHNYTTVDDLMRIKKDLEEKLEASLSNNLTNTSRHSLQS